MNVVLHLSFWLLSLLGIYSYFIYPILLRLLPSRHVTPVGEADLPIPSMSVIVTARNEQARIREKIQNLLSLSTYPGEIEIIIASDASDDDTDRIVTEFAEQGVVLVRSPVNDGKEAAQALAIAAAKGELLVFSDVATSMQGDVLARIAKHFADPNVGALSSTDRFLDRDGRPAGEGAYVRYEMWLRGQESRVSSLIGLSGSFFAARAEICRKNWATTIPSDFMTAINCIREGSVAISADDVFGYYTDLADPRKEYRRKVRTVVRGMRALAETREMLSFSKYGLFAFQIWSHKIMRWVAPWCLLLVLLINLALLDTHPIYKLTLGVQVFFYGLATLGALVPKSRDLFAVRIPYYFVAANLAVMHAALDFFRGKAVVTWTPSER